MSIYNKGWGRKRVMNTIRKNNFGQQCADIEDECNYRGEDGNMCLVGCFIPNELYTKDMEAKTASTVILKYDLEEIMPLSTRNMRDLQHFHDYDIGTERGEDFFDAVEEQLILMEAS